PKERGPDLRPRPPSPQEVGTVISPMIDGDICWPIDWCRLSAGRVTRLPGSADYASADPPDGPSITQAGRTPAIPAVLSVISGKPCGCCRSAYGVALAFWPRSGPAAGKPIEHRYPRIRNGDQCSHDLRQSSQGVAQPRAAQCAARNGARRHDVHRSAV